MTNNERAGNLSTEAQGPGTAKHHDQLWFPLFFSFLAFVPLPLVWLLVYVAPFGSPGSLAVNAAGGVPLGAAAVLASALSAWAMDAQAKRAMIIRLSIFAAVSLGAALTAGIAIHPDFFSIPFMVIVQALCVVLWKGELFYGPSAFSPGRTAFFRFGLAASVVLTAWIMLMGWALVSRSEPRWMESLLYNVYNALLAGVLYFLTIRSYGSSSRGLRVGPSSFMVDGLDFGPVIGPVACQAAAMLIERADRISCEELRLGLKGEPCICEFRNRPGFCADYSAMYNAVSKARRLIEALRVGTVESIPEQHGSSRQSWRFIPAEGVEALANPKEDQ